MPARSMVFMLHNPTLSAAALIARGLRATMARKLKGFVATLEEVDAKFRELYVEEPDPADATKVRFRLDADGVEDVTGLKSTVATLRRENGDLKKKVKPLEELEAEDIELEEVIDAGKAALEAKRTGRPVPEVEAATQRLTKQHEKAIATVKAENEGLMDALRTAVYDGVVVSEIKDAKGREKLLKPHIKEQIDIVRIQEGEKIRYEPRVFEDSNGTRVERTGADGKPFPIKALVAEMRANDDFSDAFDGSVVPGSGTPPEGGSGMPTPPSRRGTRETVPPAATAKDAKKASLDYSL